MDDNYQPSALMWAFNPNLLSNDVKILSILNLLKSLKLTAMDLVTHLLGNRNEFKTWKDGLLKSHGIEHFLNALEHDDRGKSKLDAWMRTRAANMVVETVEQEMRQAKSVMKMTMKEVTPEFLKDFQLDRDVTTPFSETTLILQRILCAATQTVRATRENVHKNNLAVTTVVESQIIKMNSALNQRCAIPIGFFFFSCGISRKVTDMLSRCGLCPSYDSIHKSHKILANGNIRRAQVAARLPHSIGWDNTNIKTSIFVEQRELGPPKVQSGTTSMIYSLRNATPDDMLLQPVLENRRRLEMITFNADIRPTRSQMRAMLASFELDIIKILFENQSGFDYAKNEPMLQHRQFRPPPKDHKTEEFVLRTTTIEEASIDGNVRVNENVYIDQLDFEDNGSTLDNIAIPGFHDQSTNARIRGAQVLRADDVTAILRLANLLLGPGFFHVQMNLLWAILRIHRGTIEAIGSLQFYIAVLEKVRLGTDKPDYHTLRSFTSQVLFGHILLFWATETGTSAANFAASKPSPSTLRKYAAQIIDKYISAAALDRARGTATLHTEDTVLRNLILLLRDLLIFYDLGLAISSGDFGRVEILLGTLTIMFTGAGCKNYTSEFLHFIQNLRKVWTPAIANVIRNNILINTSGRDNHYQGVDHNAEKNIKFQKDYFESKGLYASWEGLSDLAPNIPLYRCLKTQFTEFVGAPYQGTTHSAPDVSSLIYRVRDKAKELHLHVLIPGRQAESGFQTKDILAEGTHELQKKGMKRFEKRYKIWVRDSTPYAFDIGTDISNDSDISDEEE